MVDTRATDRNDASRETLRILLVEDSPLLAERLREEIGALENVIIVDTADTERDAILMAQRQPIDVIILDLQLRIGTGFGVLHALGASKPIVIVLSNYALPEYEKRVKQLGVQHFLDKSRDLDRLIGLIEAVRNGSARRDH